MFTPRDQSIFITSIVPSKRYILVACIAVLTLFSLQNFKTVRREISTDVFRDRYGQYAVVAGASEGLGEEWALALSRKGMSLILIARREDKLLKVKERVLAESDSDGAIDVKLLVQDLSDPALEEKFRDFASNLRIGFLVYNAAYVPKGLFTNIESARAYKSIDVNLRGLHALTMVTSQQMIRENRSGGIVIMSSMSGIVGTGRFASYSASKSYQIAFAHALWYEFQAKNVDVLACVAGPTRTPNYLGVVHETTRKRWIEQDPSDVVDECLSAVGEMPSVATGVLNKISRVLMARILPTKLAVALMGDETYSQISFLD